MAGFVKKGLENGRHFVIINMYMHQGINSQGYSGTNGHTAGFGRKLLTMRTQVRNSKFSRQRYFLLEMVV